MNEPTTVVKSVARLQNAPVSVSMRYAVLVRIRREAGVKYSLIKNVGYLTTLSFAISKLAQRR